jgi:lysyl-tRNA synthetase class 2
VETEPIVELAKEAGRALMTFSLAFEPNPENQGKWSNESLVLLEKITGSITWLKNPFLQFTTPKIIDLTPNWRRVKYKDLIRETIYKNWFEISCSERFSRFSVLGEEPNLHAARNLEELATLIRKDEAGREIRVRQRLEMLSNQISTFGMPSDIDVTSDIFEKFIEPRLIQPTFVTHLPKELVPLAKLSPDDPTTVEVFECCINGQEIAPAYTEQNDPVEQRERLEHQAGGEQQKLDEDFLVALEHGMPPAGGMGLGIDRLCMMLLGQESIRDVILFPQLKPK